MQNSTVMVNITSGSPTTALSLDEKLQQVIIDACRISLSKQMWFEELLNFFLLAYRPTAAEIKHERGLNTKYKTFMKAAKINK